MGKDTTKKLKKEAQRSRSIIAVLRGG